MGKRNFVDLGFPSVRTSKPQRSSPFPANRFSLTDITDFPIFPDSMMRTATMTRRNFPLLLLLVAAAMFPQMLAQPAAAQEAGTAKPEKFSFGPPLRGNAVFAYEFSERVKMVARDTKGEIQDSTERNVRYYVTMRQVLLDKKQKLMKIETNVDSMVIDFSNKLSGDYIYFNTQQMPSQSVIRHREVFAPSVLINRMVSFQITPYGQIVKTTSPALDDVKEQAKTPGIPDAEFSRRRIAQVCNPEYLAWMLLPWRGLLPLGQTVAMNTPMQQKFSGVLDRLTFQSTATTTLLNDSLGQRLRFTAPIASSAKQTGTLSLFPKPVAITGMKGNLTGELKLEQDGVVSGAWIGATGTATANVNGEKLTLDISHEFYAKQVGLTPFFDEVE